VKSRAFVDSVKADASGFHFMVIYYDSRSSLGIAFLTGEPRPGTRRPQRITRSEAARIAEYSAGKGLLEKSLPTDARGRLIPPCGRRSPGWYVHLFTDKVGAHWHRWTDKSGLLSWSDILGVRSAMSGKAAKAWDDFLQDIRAMTTPNTPSEPTR